MAEESVESQVRALLEKRSASHDIDIVDVEIVGSHKAPCVRVRIDYVDESRDTITLDEVAQETAWISDALDEADPFEGAYSLEVSSPGLDRPLSKARDFERFKGETIALTLNISEGRKRYTGELLGLVDNDHFAMTSDGERFEFALADIKKCKIKPDFEAALKGKK